MPQTKQKQSEKKKKKKKNVHEDVNINRNVDQTQKSAKKMLASLTSSSEKCWSNNQIKREGKRGKKVKNRGNFAPLRLAKSKAQSKKRKKKKKECIVQSSPLPDQ